MLDVREAKLPQAGSEALEATAPVEHYSLLRAWIALVILVLLLVAGGVDSSIVNLLVDPIEKALRINDIGFASVTTTAITLGAITFMYPAGMFADLFRRRDIILVSALIWTAAALVSARTDSVPMFFLARFLAGVGLSCSAPAIFSIITDAFPRAHRPLAVGVYTAAISLGMGVGLAVCGALVAAANRNGVVHLDGMTFVPWQQCFVAVAAIGIVVSILLLLVREPPRLERSLKKDATLVSNMKLFMQYMRKHWLLWTLFFIGSCIGTTSAGSVSAWGPAFGTRHYGIPSSSAGALLGIFVAAGSLLGSITGSALSRLSMKYKRPRLLPRMLMIVTAVSVPVAFAFPYMPTWILAAAGMGFVSGQNLATGALDFIAVQEATTNEVRGQLFSFFTIVAYISLIFGANLVAWVADAFFAKTGGLGPSLAVVGGVTTIAGVICFAFCEKPYEAARNEIIALQTSSD